MNDASFSSLEKSIQVWFIFFSAEMASTLMEACEHARSYVLGPFSPNYQINKVLTSTLNRVSLVSPKCH